MGKADEDSSVRKNALNVFWRNHRLGFSSAPGSLSALVGVFRINRLEIFLEGQRTLRLADSYGLCPPLAN
jgi:hypothetical protein